MKKTILFLSIFISTSFIALADEGMWLPQLLQSLNEKRMKKLGMKISAEDIYSINKSSLKDAVVSLGGFCTAEVISREGLLLTNHHCGFDAVQNHSSMEHNYIRDGFWAYEKSQELTNPGLFVSFIIRIEEVTNMVLKDVTNDMPEKDRQVLIDKNITDIKKNFIKEIDQDLVIRPFFEGNNYFLFVTETFKDVRLVGAPPSSIGNFGKDTDNWMWPRHTGDFSLFRIYANKNNRPAAYAPDNIPYVPKKALTLSLKGIKEGDFTMVFGFPGRTNEYLPSSAVKQIMEVSDPVKISIRHEVLRILKENMILSEPVKIKYAAKYATIENGYKKWKGEVLGLSRTNALDKKLDYEQAFAEKIKQKTAWNSSYGTLLQKLKDNYSSLQPFGFARDYFNEIIPRIELFNMAGALNTHFSTQGKDASANIDRNKKLLDKLNDILLECEWSVDQQLFQQLISMYVNNQPEENISPYLRTLLKQKTVNQLTKELYNQSPLTKIDSLKKLLETDPNTCWLTLKNDPAMALYLDMSQTYQTKILPTLTTTQSEINRLQRTYMRAQIEVFSDKSFYPDANGTMRVAYANVKGYQPRDGMKYEFYTYMDGIMEKYKPGDYEFDVPKKLIELYENKDFGRYGNKGRMPVCFIASNHTTGGNSGSPVLNANGELIGLNFDRVWEGTMSDINYDPSICRNIMVDIRYVLFIIDKFAGASKLIGEINAK